MNLVLENLLKLQNLEFGEERNTAIETQIAELRAVVTQPFLGHYDRLRERGKKGLALIRNHVCTGCHMKLPIGKVMIVMRDEDIQLCDSCGRYLYILEEAPPPVPESTPGGPVEVKKTRKPRKPKQPKGAKAEEPPAPAE